MSSGTPSGPRTSNRRIVYIDSITLRAFRTFERASIDFVHPDTPDLPAFERPRLPNMNLAIGNNGSGKTTLLKGIALAVLGPAVEASGIFSYHLIRRTSGEPVEAGALVEVTLTPGTQDDYLNGWRRSDPAFASSAGGAVQSGAPGRKHWHPIYSSRSDAFSWSVTAPIAGSRDATAWTRRGVAFGKFLQLHSL
ncbi:MAG: AAA family ATPase [Acidobacteria bacterium]|nr:AAA family ATPase [Acidobacteriota bacterium]MYH31911.1 AAA family ATPase [Acidobacteriota bacterium]